MAHVVSLVRAISTGQRFAAVARGRSIVSPIFLSAVLNIIVPKILI